MKSRAWRGSAVTTLAADLLLGEPPAPMHPTVWMGRWINRRRATRRSMREVPSFAEGVIALGAGVLMAGAAGLLAATLIDRTPAPMRPMIGGLALKPALSLRALTAAAAEVRGHLARGRLDAARRTLAWHLVSRDTSDLSVAEVAGATIESVAENLSDGLVAPLLAFRVGGLPAAYVYRMVNTADAMLGYHTSELEWFGKPAARADDAMNFVPARVCAVLICATAMAGGGSTWRAMAVGSRDASRTASPNAGWPMAAMAGALDVRLTKRGHYALHDAGREPTAGDIDRACRIALAAGSLAALLADLT